MVWIPLIPYLPHGWSVSNVPWTDPQIEVSEKVASFFQALQLLEARLELVNGTFNIGFFILAMILRRIIAATAIHPRLGILIETIVKGADGLSHFAILFTLVFVLLSVVSWWSFANDYDDFKDFGAAMTTQFSLFIFTVPPSIDHAFKNPSDNYPLVVLAVVSIVTESFLMCNFLVRFEKNVVGIHSVA